VARFWIDQAGPHRNPNEKILSGPSGLSVLSPPLSLLGKEVGMIEQMDEAFHLDIADKDNISSFTAISSIRTSFRAKPFSPKAETAASSIATSQENLHVINEFHAISL
jgi:hypothetical protein